MKAHHTTLAKTSMGNKSYIEIQGISPTNITPNAFTLTSTPPSLAVALRVTNSANNFGNLGFFAPSHGMHEFADMHRVSAPAFPYSDLYRSIGRPVAPLTTTGLAINPVLARQPAPTVLASPATSECAVAAVAGGVGGTWFIEENGALCWAGVGAETVQVVPASVLLGHTLGTGNDAVTDLGNVVVHGLCVDDDNRAVVGLLGQVVRVTRNEDEFTSETLAYGLSWTPRILSKLGNGLICISAEGMMVHITDDEVLGASAPSNIRLAVPVTAGAVLVAPSGLYVINHELVVNLLVPRAEVEGVILSAAQLDGQIVYGTSDGLVRRVGEKGCLLTHPRAYAAAALLQISETAVLVVFTNGLSIEIGLLGSAPFPWPLSTPSNLDLARAARVTGDAAALEAALAPLRQAASARHKLGPFMGVCALCDAPASFTAGELVCTCTSGHLVGRSSQGVVVPWDSQCWVCGGSVEAGKCIVCENQEKEVN